MTWDMSRMDPCGRAIISTTPAPHAHTCKNDRTCVRQHSNLTGLVLTQTDSCQFACNQSTYRQEMKQSKNTSQYSTRSLYHGQRPTRLFHAAYRSPFCHCPRLGSVPNEAGYLVRASIRVHCWHKTLVVSGVCVVCTQPASTVFTAAVPLTRETMLHPC